MMEERVREKRPLVHHITNEVVMNFSANGLLAFGGSPVMAKEREEVADIAGAADALVLNIGTLRSSDVETMIAAGKAANEKGIPILLDPVGAGASTFRKNAVRKITEELDVAVVKGNAGEIAALADIPLKVKGVDSEESGDSTDIALRASEKLNTCVVVTGAIDIVAENGNYTTSSYGSPLLTQVTGSGCLLGTLIAACLTVEDEKEKAVLFAVEFYNKAAERAEANSHGPGSFAVSLLDELGGDV
ncbi:hydroxyethylthiazole kinase [Salimicrobium salexigens]|nr:hydroxyethylthiazole kinase [Salimicrobium salexigens]